MTFSFPHPLKEIKSESSLIACFEPSNAIVCDEQNRRRHCDDPQELTVIATVKEQFGGKEKHVL